VFKACLEVLFKGESVRIIKLVVKLEPYEVEITRLGEYHGKRTCRDEEVRVQTFITLTRL
jgi:hypothetical protein